MNEQQAERNERHEDPDAGRLPVTVLTGFLGSGKTTLLAHLLQDPAMAGTACIINEFGEIGLDHALVRQVDDETVLMASGCLCCTVRSDLVDTLRDLFLKKVKHKTIDFDRVMIETTGLADPAPVLHTLMTDPMVVGRFRLDGVVATVDGVFGMGQLDQHQESVKQAAMADRLVLTKTDIAEPADLETLAERLRRLNPAATIYRSAQGQLDPAALFGAGLYNPETKSADVRRWLNEEALAESGHDHHHEHGHGHGQEHGHGHHHHDVNRHDESIRAFCLTFDAKLEWRRFAHAMDLLASTHGANLLRVKGLLNVTDVDKPVVVHGVQHMFHPPVMLEKWPDADHRCKLVCITRDVPAEDLEGMLRALLGLEREAEPAGR